MSRSGSGALRRAGRLFSFLVGGAGLTFVLFASPAHAGPAAPLTYRLEQPDGDTFAARRYGDEWQNGTETSNGYTVVKDAKGRWTYAVKDETGRLRPGARAADQPAPAGLKRHLRGVGAKRAELDLVALSSSFEVGRSYIDEAVVSEASIASAAPDPAAINTGAQKTLVILTEFNDQAHQTLPSEWSSKFFGETDSVRAYYNEVSYGELDLTPAPETSGTANDGVVGWVTLNQNHPNTGGSTGSTNRLLTRDAVLAADPFVNFAAFDTNGNGIISTTELHVTIIVAGNEASYAPPCGKTVWGHRWALGFTIEEIPQPDGKYVGYGAPGEGGYTQFGEMHCSSSFPAGNHMATIGIMVHEMGHDLNLPDLYDTNSGNGTSEGVGVWSVMGSGSWLSSAGGQSGSRPAHMDAWSKSYEGWVTPQQLTGIHSDVAVDQASTSPDVIRLGANPNGVDWTFNGSSGAGEYFLVENRQLSGFDAGLPGCGLLVWHIDETGSSTEPNGDETRPLVKVMQADNLNHLENTTNRGDAGDLYPGTALNMNFTDASSPNSKLYGGAATNFEMKNPGVCGATMTPDFATPDTTAPTNPSLSASPVANAWSTDNTVTVSGFGSAQDEANGSGVDGFSYEWNTSPSTVPNTTVEVQENTTSLTSTPLSDGNSHYFHVRTVDVAGNGSTTVHLGPFFVDATKPVTGALDAAPAENTWSSDNTVTLSNLDTANDPAGGSGVDGFSVAWDGSPTTVPNATIDVQQDATSIVSPTLSEGSSHYAHVRTVDSAGNVSDTSHFGPFKIDRTDPINPPLQSSSHTAGNWSTSNEVTVTGLDEASDAEGSSGAGASGVAGFSYVWNSNATTTPDASIEEAAGSVSFTSPALDEGSHYLHLRTVDGAGNAAGVVHLGPFKLDATAPSSVNLTTLSPFSKALSLPLAWTASTDEGSGFDGYTVASRSSMWNAAGLMTATFSDLPTKYTVTSATVQGTPGTSYCFKVRAADMLGNSSEGSESCTAVPLNDASLTRSGTWKTASSSDIYFDSKLSTSSVSGSKLTRQGIKGAKRLAVLVTTCNGCGTIQVLWNGVALQRAGTTSTKISLASTSTKKKVLVQLKPLAGLQDGTAIIKVVTSGKPVKIEGLGIARF